MDKIHREIFFKFPTKAVTIYNAPPGAGKTSTMKKAVRNWKNKKILIIVYNKTDQTLDALCMTAISGKMGTLIQNENFDKDATVF